MFPRGRFLLSARNSFLHRPVHYSSLMCVCVCAGDTHFHLAYEPPCGPDPAPCLGPRQTLERENDRACEEYITAAMNRKGDVKKKKRREERAESRRGRGKRKQEIKGSSEKNTGTFPTYSKYHITAPPWQLQAGSRPAKCNNAKKHKHSLLITAGSSRLCEDISGGKSRFLAHSAARGLDCTDAAFPLWRYFTSLGG